MREITLFELAQPYREPLTVKGYLFGGNEQTVCVIGALRGNEVQQLYTASQLVRRLNHLEQRGAVASDCGIMVVPCINTASVNVSKRFWPSDNTDINRMFPGFDRGETTQRIAAALFEIVKDYQYGIQFPSFHLSGHFLPHVRIMNADGADAALGDAFGARYVVKREPNPFDTTTLNYNWRLWDTDAYSLYTRTTDTIDDQSAQEAMRACLRFLARIEVLNYPCHQGFCSSHINEAQLAAVHTNHGGIFHRLVGPGDVVSKGETVAQILSPLTGETLETVRASVGGIVFFACNAPLVTEHTLAFSLVPRYL